jgi:hypothetical protein
MVTRRQLFGSAAIAATAGCSGDTARQQDVSTGDSERTLWSEREADGSRWGLLTPTTHDGVQADQVRAGTSWAVPGNSHTDRPARLVSNRDEDIYVSIEDGDDENGGRSTDDAYRTINRALAEVPKFVYHKIRVHIDYGDYTGTAGPSLFHIHCSADGSRGLKIWGHTEDNDYYDDSKSAEDIVFTYGLDSGCIGSEELTVKGITIDGFWQSYDSSIRFFDCVFKGGWKPEGRDKPERLVGAHRNRAQYIDCQFEDSEIVGLLSPLSYTSFDNCTATEITDYPFWLYSSSTIFLTGSDELVTVPPNPSEKDPSSRIVNHPEGQVQAPDGRPQSQGTHTFDDGLRVRDERADGEESIVLRNRDGELVGFDGEGNRLGTLTFES